ncbi:hypothetical protein [Burkholderia cepacia]|uniref:hypothetical protein n=1 Tax=Burkholderia cepacia TaxID=292 RepID=UPI000F5E3CC8|nr:hypothetical protein [Burkholderia cepacia]RQT22756.1 hypothetical protein DF135_36350 [Burkholderia cepacia]
MLVHIEPGSALDRLETELAFTAGFPPDVVRRFRMRMQQLRAFAGVADLENSRALDARRVRGHTALSVRLTDDWRLHLRLLQTPDGLRVDVLEVVESIQKTRRPR